MLFKETIKVGDDGGLKSYLGGIQKEMNWNTWRPFVAGAELAHIIPAIGQDLYDQLIQAQLDPAPAKLKEKLRLALAWFAYLEAMPSLATQTGDAGLAMPSVPNTAAVPKWLFVETKKAAQDKADRYFEAALQWLELNADSFPEWKASEFYLIQESKLIGSASEATRYFPPIQRSRRLYLNLRGYFNLAEEDQIAPFVGVAFYRDLMDRHVQDGPLSVHEVEVLRLAKKAVVQLGFAEAIPYLNMNTDFRLVSETDGIVNEGVLALERIRDIQQTAKDKAEVILASLRGYLNHNASASVFPIYFNSSLYTAPQTRTGSSSRPDNSPSNSWFAL